MRRIYIWFLLFFLLLTGAQAIYQNFDYIKHDDQEEISINNAILKEIKEDQGWLVSSTDDSWIEFRNINKKVNRLSLDITYNNSNSGDVIQLFYTGNNSVAYAEERSFKSEVINSDSQYMFDLNEEVDSLRIDIVNRKDVEFIINQITINPKPNFNFNISKWFLNSLLLSLFIFVIYTVIKKIDIVVKYRYLIATIIFILLVLFKVHGSSIGMWDTYVRGEERSTTLIGVERGIRSDEWLVQTPYLFSQAKSAELYKYKNDNIRSDGQNMVLANAPTFTIETIGKPFLWGYLLFGTDYGLSWFWFSKLMLLVLFSFEICMILTRDNKALSLLGAMWIAFSPPTQWWFSTTFVELIVYSQAIIVAINYFIKSKKEIARIGYIFATALSFLGFVFTIYPAIQVPMGFLTAVFVFGLVYNAGFKKIAESFTKKETWSLVVCALIVIAAFITFIINSKADLKLLLGTVYPGEVVNSGGGYSFKDLQMYLLSWLLPYKDIHFSNQSEISSFINFFPAMMLGLVMIFVSKKMGQVENKKIIIPIFAYFIFQLSWLFIPYPEIVGKITLFSFVNEGRLAQFVFGLTALYLTIWFIDVIVKMKPYKNIEVFLICSCIAFIYVYSIYNTGIKDYLSGFLIITGVAFLLINVFILKGMKKSLITSVFILIVVSGFTVNPIAQGTDSIFNKEIAIEIQKINKEPGNKWVAVDSLVNGQYLVSLGSKTFNSVHFYPDLPMWRSLDQTHSYEEVYNRYAHVIVHLTMENQASFDLLNPDVIRVNLNYNDLLNAGVDYILSPSALEQEDYVKRIFYDSTSNLYIYKLEEGNR
ncbi:hypothetical protein P4H67_28375 [Paenibacillus lautus]|uniref:DUF7657 domain-containing protein n=1 Tax=Paenibacillus lautus TaxID=1401 RepID=UPI002DB81412|nr:hypothetical protein [Paenibacillus lautus]MEC0310684.1 hypothetical protein [Paenibacillus lautus]